LISTAATTHGDDKSAPCALPGSVVYLPQRVGIFYFQKDLARLTECAPFG